VIPNASDDPFGAMNAMAAHGSSQRAPEIIIVNDGRPVEHVGASKRAAGLVIPVAVGVGALILGYVVAGILSGQDAAKSAKATKKAMQTLVGLDRKQIGNLKSAFEGAGNLRDPKVSEELTKALAAADDDLGKNKLKALALRQDNLGSDLRAMINLFYAQVTEIHDLIVDHQATIEYEQAAIKTNAAVIERFGVKDGDALSKANAPFKIGIMLTNPADAETAKEPQAARIVEIGAPLCGNDISTAKPALSGNCKEGDGIAGFLYRYDATTNLDGATDSWSKGKVMFPGSLAPGDKFPVGEIILLQPSQVLESLGKTAEGSLAGYAYFKRLSKVYDKIKASYELGEALEKALNAK
jgi:hypothetical protein